MGNDTDRIVAVLHDVLEGCSAWSSGRLRSNGFSEEIIGAIEALTRYPWESEETFISRAGRNGIARRVKLADLAANRDLSRNGVASQTDLERAAKLQHEIEMLEAA
ncbi:hypothetical protein JNW90_34515 [Micromonospora sp. STR1s_5]|nr:hypothetical protein [Micromonospora sp. STR1s_5]